MRSWRISNGNLTDQHERYKKDSTCRFAVNPPCLIPWVVWCCLFLYCPNFIYFSIIKLNNSFVLSFNYPRYSLSFFQAEDGIRDSSVTGVQTCALPISIFRIHSKNRDATVPKTFLILETLTG